MDLWTQSIRRHTQLLHMNFPVSKNINKYTFLSYTLVILDSQEILFDGVIAKNHHWNLTTFKKMKTFNFSGKCARNVHN